MQNANGSNIVAVVVKLGRVMKDQNSGIGGRESITRGLEMSHQNIPFGNAVVGEETIRRFCVCPVLANQRNALVSAIGKLLEKFSKSLVESDVSEFASGELAIDPGFGLGSSGMINLP